MSSVGAYQLEGEGLQLFEKIDGDYFTILGLPMLPLLQKLRELELSMDDSRETLGPQRLRHRLSYQAFPVALLSTVIG